MIEVKRSIFEATMRDADKLRAELKSEGTFLLNLMSSGRRKDNDIKRTISMLKDEMKIGVMEADIDSDVDAQAISETGGKCHPDPYRWNVPSGCGHDRTGIWSSEQKTLDFVVLENVGQSGLSGRV